MVTLTYRDDVDWSPRQVSNYLKCVREWARRKGIFIHYVWVLELTKRGRPHYHVLFGCLKVFLCLKPINKAGGNMG